MFIPPRRENLLEPQSHASQDEQLRLFIFLVLLTTLRPPFPLEVSRNIVPSRLFWTGFPRRNVASQHCLLHLLVNTRFLSSVDLLRCEET